MCGFVGAQIRRRLVASLATLTERNRVVGMFGQYVSPAVVDQLLTRPVEAAGEVRDVTIMFLDIRGFTAFAEHRTPTEVVDYLNTLFGAMIALVNANHGIINKFLGDGFMACFGAPLSDGRDTQNAVRAALEIAQTVERMSADGTIAPTRIGIGLHAGTRRDRQRRQRRAPRVHDHRRHREPRLAGRAAHQAIRRRAARDRRRVAGREGRLRGAAARRRRVRGREEPVAIYALR